MSLFSRLEASKAIVSVPNGLLKQVDLYTWNGGLYIAIAGGYARIFKDGRTTHPKVEVRHLDLDTPAQLFADSNGRVTLLETPILVNRAPFLQIEGKANAT